MLKRLTSVVLIFSIMCSSISIILVHIGFESNKKYIAEKFCKNRSRPWMQCKGKCVLAKKLKEAQEREAKETYKAPQYEAVLNYASSNPCFYPIANKQDDLFNGLDIPSSYLNEIFHPPTILM